MGVRGMLSFMQFYITIILLWNLSCIIHILWTIRFKLDLTWLSFNFLKLQSRCWYLLQLWISSLSHWRSYDRLLQGLNLSFDRWNQELLLGCVCVCNFLDITKFYRCRRRFLHDQRLYWILWNYLNGSSTFWSVTKVIWVFIFVLLLIRGHIGKEREFYT